MNEFDEVVNNHIQIIFPQLVATQILNSLVMRQILPKGPDHFELIFYFFGYADDTPEMRLHRIDKPIWWAPQGWSRWRIRSQQNWCSSAQLAAERRCRSLTWALTLPRRNRPGP